MLKKDKNRKYKCLVQLEVYSQTIEVTLCLTHIIDLKDLLIVKFNYVLLLGIHHELYLFESPSLKKYFLRDLYVEHKVIPPIRSPNARFRPSNTGNFPNLPFSSPHTSLVSSHNAPWCYFH
jgi:hypothetical protein